jgi:hypothetical protein
MFVLAIHFLDNMKQPAAILVLQYWYTILVVPVFSQNLPVSAILEDTGHCQNMSIVDTGRFWERKYWYSNIFTQG